MAKKIRTDLPYEVNVIENTWIPMSDGVKLSSRIWQPVSDKPLPAVLEYIPYRKSDGTRARDEPMHGYISGHGYVCVRVDQRGSGESTGYLEDEYIKQEQDDALEVIDWISKQPWCDGNVGMMGKSWGGFNSLQVAFRQPPALRAILIVGFTDDRYNDDIHYKNGCLLNDNLWWGSIMLADQSRAIEPRIAGDGWREQWLDRLEHMPHWPVPWMQHALRDEYWKHGSICEDYSRIQVPVLAFDGYSDSYTNPVLRLMEHLQVPRRCVIGPWAHVYAHDGYPEPAVGFLQEAVRWWDHWLKGIDNDAMTPPQVQAWMEEYLRPSAIQNVSPGRWVGLDSWPSPDVSERRLALAAGKLGDAKAPFTVKTPLSQGLLAGEWMGAGVPGESPSDQRIDDGQSVVFELDLAEPLEIFGYPKVEFEVVSDKPNAQLFARLCDVAPDGASTRVSYGTVNLTQLQGQDKYAPLVPGQAARGTLQLDCIGHQFPAGHKLRLSLASSAWPLLWPMPDDAELTVTAELVLPVFSGKDAAGPIPDPESAALTPITQLSEGFVTREVSYDIVSDTWTAITDGRGGVFGEGIIRFDEIDEELEHNLKRELTLTNSDPLSAKYVLVHNMRIGREGWMTEAKIRTQMTCDYDNFYVKSEMVSTENGVEVFAKKWDDTIPRVGH
ncbi:MAG: CocE/NonD family hydrolase [Propionibacteriaceae bacterium]|jgi:putative CocE/NonD family hydrolase|nr:CocE/NonD family hydrolase [Propionibacteriaceae bacterium]